MEYKFLKFCYPIGLFVLTSSILLICFKQTLVNYSINQVKIELLSRTLINFNFLFDSIKNTQLLPGKDLYSSWVNMPVELHTNFYLFNLVNGYAFENLGEKPMFEQIGPFVYKEVRIKEDVVHNMNGTITYKERRLFYYLPDKSSYPENFTITSINMAVMTVLNLFRYANRIESETVNIALKLFGETLLIKQPASDLLFGYEDPFLKILHTIDKSILPSDKIGLYFNVNIWIWQMF